MTDWVIPVRNGEDNEELRFSIRTWVANAGLVEGLDRLVTVGDHPAWLSPDLHIPGNRHRSGPLNVYANVRDACASGLLGDRIVVANDDMYAMGRVTVAAAHRGPLREHIGRLPQQATWWASSLRLTHNLLRKQGVAAPLSYELHRPLPVVTEDMARVLTDSWSGHGFPPQFRTMYGNVCGIGGVRDVDGKMVSRVNYPPPTPWWSTTDGSWRWVGGDIAALYPTPTQWEVLTHTHQRGTVG